jgi:hypothetical protein
LESCQDPARDAKSPTSREERSKTHLKPSVPPQPPLNAGPQDNDSNKKKYIHQTQPTSYNMSSTTAITEVDLSKYNIKKIASGKVREIFEIDDKTLLFVATDRISAYDVILNNVSPLFLSFDNLSLFDTLVWILWNYTMSFPPSIYPVDHQTIPSTTKMRKI